MFLCQIVMLAVGSLESLPALAGRGNPAAATASGTSSLEKWAGQSRSGWIRHHLTTARVLPLPLAMLVCSAIQVACEEVVFRGVFIPLLSPAGAEGSAVLAGFLFIAMQVFFMKGWRSAMFPVVGALVMATVHGALFLAFPSIWPLLVAHVMFFFFAVL